jgi:ribonucleoside-diphosphate reductase beta chain
VDLFSEAWASAWGQQINADEAYRTSGRRWTGALILRRADREEAGVFVDLAAGACREARLARPRDEDRARVVIEAPDATWRRVLAGEIDPILGLLRGTLGLAKGSLLALVPHQAGARALLAAATRVGTDRGAVPKASTVSRPPVATKPHSATSGSPPSFRTTAGPGLDHGLFPMRLYHKAKKLGVWDPRDLDLSRDRQDWMALSPAEQDLLLRLTALFQAGEEAVTRDLLPLIQVVSEEGRLEEEMYLTTFLFEEAKHVEVFRRFFDEVAPEHGDLTRFETPSYRLLFHEELPRALHALREDTSPAAQVGASVTYNMIVEGVLAETGYRGYQATLEANGILPGMQDAIRKVKRDESRHIAYGLYLLSRLVVEHGEGAWKVVESELSRLLDPALAVVQEVFAAYEAMPFGLALEDFTEFALQQFQSRLRRLDVARRAGGLVEELTPAMSEGG